MNPSTILGMLAGGALIVGMVLISADDARIFLNLPGLAFVLGGTIAATLISYPMAEVLRVLKVFLVVLRNERLYAEHDIGELVDVARVMFSGDLRETERRLEKVQNPFLRTGVQLVLDNAPKTDILDLMQWRIARLKARERAEAQVFHTMSGFAPAFGMLGTLLGLINMLYAMGEDGFTTIGRNMALAMITTLYGIALANMLFKPIALKLERRTEQRVMLMNMVLEGVMMMREKRSPSLISETLHSFIAHVEDEIRQPGGRR